MKLFLQKKLSTYIFSILGVLFALWTIIPAVSVGQFADEPFPYQIQGQDYSNDTTSEENMTNLATDVIKTDTNESTSILQRLTDFFRLSGTSYDTGTSKATNYVKRILNILLGFVSFLSLVMIIFAFYLIFFSKGEEGAAKAKKILIGVGIALAIMWLSWFIASFFFNIYTVVTT